MKPTFLLPTGSRSSRPLQSLLVAVSFISCANVWAVEQNYDNDFAEFKRKVPVARREAFLADWRKKEPSNPDSWIISANYYFEQADALDTNVAGIDMHDLIPKGRKRAEFAIKMEGDDIYLFDKKTGQRIGRMNIHSRRESGKAQEAIEFLVAARKRFPNRMDIHLGLINAYDQLGADEAKVDALRQLSRAAHANASNLRWCHDAAISVDPQEFLISHLHHYAADYYEKQTSAADGRFFQVVEILVQSCPNRPETWNDVALSRDLKKDAPGVQKALLKASELDPTDSLVLFNLATNSLKLGLRSDAIAAFEKIVALNNNEELATTARQKLAELKEKPNRR